MQRELAAIFGRTVDLVPKGGLKPAIRAAVLADCTGDLCAVIVCTWKISVAVLQTPSSVFWLTLPTALILSLR